MDSEYCDTRRIVTVFAWRRVDDTEFLCTMAHHAYAHHADPVLSASKVSDHFVTSLSCELTARIRTMKL